MVLWLSCGLGQAARAKACASCSGGSGDPLVLYPSESMKVYLGLGHAMVREMLTSDGEQGWSAGPTRQSSMVLSVGGRLWPGSFATLTLPALLNSAPRAAAAGVGDPSMAVRATLVGDRQDLPWRPQLQLLGGFRAGIAHSSTAGTVRRRDLMDQFGDGNNELRAGVDLWWNRLAIKAGVAGMVLVPLARTLPATGERSRAGNTWRLVVTTGINLGQSGRWLVSVVRDAQGDRVTQGRRVARSGRRSLNLQMAVDLFVGGRDTLRLSVGRSAMLWSRNATRDVSAGVAYMHAW